jgi:hypothetical protein
VIVPTHPPGQPPISSQRTGQHTGNIGGAAAKHARPSRHQPPTSSNSGSMNAFTLAQEQQGLGRGWVQPGPELRGRDARRAHWGEGLGEREMQGTGGGLGHTEKPRSSLAKGGRGSVGTELQQQRLSRATRSPDQILASSSSGSSSHKKRAPYQQQHSPAASHSMLRPNSSSSCGTTGGDYGGTGVQRQQVKCANTPSVSTSYQQQHGHA